MASNKQGFNYFNIDTDRYQDGRIKRLKKNLGCTGLSVYDYVLCEIYRVKGCFIVWDENTAFDVADYLEIKETVVQEVVNYCCNVGLFNKELRASENVLSSESIQRRFLEMSNRAKRKKFIIPEKYYLIQEDSDIIQEQLNIIPEKNAIILERVKESKVKKSKVKNSRIIPEEDLSPKIGVESLGNPDNGIFTVTELLGFTMYPYEMRTVEFKKMYTEQQYQRFCEFTKKQTSEYPNLNISDYQVTIVNFKKKLEMYSDEVLEEGLKRVSRSGSVNKNTNMVEKILQYIGYYHQDLEKDKLKSSNSATTTTLSAAEQDSYKEKFANQKRVEKKHA